MKPTEPFDALHRLFYPYVEAACKPKIEAEMAVGMPDLDLDDQTIEQLKEFLRVSARHQGMSDEEAEKAIADAEKEMRNPRPFTAEEVAASVREESEVECSHMISNWLQLCYFAAAPDGKGRTLDAKAMDDAMLPPLGAVLEHGINGQTGEDLFAECCNGILDVEETRAVLRQVKAALPPGQMLPVEAEVWLAMQNVTVLR